MSHPPTDTTTRYPDSCAAWLRRAVLPLLGAVLLFGCGNNRYCDGPNCDCEGNRECIVSCGDDCDAACSGTSEACGAICGDDCAFECFGTPDCSSLSGDGAYVSCHNVTSCAAECGANCTYSAADVTDVRITVGPGSAVSCDRLSDCLVTCEGDCEVSCTMVGNCEVKCPTGLQKLGAGSHKVVCE